MEQATQVLPFAVEEDGGKPLAYSREATLVLCSVEAERKKSGILGSQEEKVSFVSNLNYPLWVISKDGQNIMVDGLGALTYTYLYLEPPDVERFTEDLKRCTVDRGLYLGTLKSHEQTFSEFILPIPCPLRRWYRVAVYFQNFRKSLGREHLKDCSCSVPHL